MVKYAAMDTCSRTKGIAAITVSAFGFALMAACVRLADDFGAPISSFQKSFFRNVVALVIALTLICAVVTAKCIACSLPMLATKIHLDPALMATPLLTTIVDACTVFVYFFIATHLIPGLR